MPELAVSGAGAQPARPAATLLLAALAWSCGMIHLQAAADHLSESLLYALLFVLLAAMQLAWGTAVWRGAGSRVTLAGAAVNLVAICVWALSRTWGLPGGDDAAGAEPLGLLDVLASVDEGVMILLGLGGLPRFAGRARGGRGALSASATVLVLAGCLLLASGVHAH